MTYLSLRNGTYYFRSRIPGDLVAILGRSTVYRSLNTPSLRLALKRCRLIVAALTEIFDDAREGRLRRDAIRQRLESVFHEILERQCKYIDRYGTKSHERTEFLRNVSNDLRGASEFERQGQTESVARALKATDVKFTLERVRRAMRRLDHKAQSAQEASLMRVEVLQMLGDYYEQAASLHELSKRYVYSPAKVPSDPPKGDGNDRIFPDLKLTKNGYGDAVSKWFGRTFKDRLTLKPGNKSFHSLRHSFVTALKRANVPEPAVKAIVGHAESSITFGRYGGSVLLKDLANCVEEFKIENRNA